MIGAAIGGGLKVASSVIGGISAAKAAKKVQKNLEQRKAANQAWYDQRYNEDALQRADAQRAIAQTEAAIRNRTRSAAGTSAVMGGTEAAAAASREANATALSNTMSNIAANADKRKDTIENQYIQQRNSIDDSLNDLQRQKAKQIAGAVQGVADAGAGMAGAF